MRYGRAEKIKHLEFIQNVVSRMNTNSFILKGWSLTLILALIGLTITKKNLDFTVLAILPAISFWGLDAYYLRQESLFRKLYDYVRKEGDVEAFSMNTTKFKNDVSSWIHVAFSPTIFFFHAVIIAGILAVIAVKLEGG